MKISASLEDCLAAVNLQRAIDALRTDKAPWSQRKLKSMGKKVKFIGRPLVNSRPLANLVMAGEQSRFFGFDGRSKIWLFAEECNLMVSYPGRHIKIKMLFLNPSKEW